jgi:hypothetical protein
MPRFIHPEDDNWCFLRGRRITTCLYIIVSNYSADVGIYVVVFLIYKFCAYRQMNGWSDFNGHFSGMETCLKMLGTTRLWYIVHVSQMGERYSCRNLVVAHTKFPLKVMKLCETEIATLRCILRDMFVGVGDGCSCSRIIFRCRHLGVPPLDSITGECGLIALYSSEQACEMWPSSCMRPTRAHCVACDSFWK